MLKLHVVDSKNIYGTMNGSSVSLTNINESDKEMIMRNRNLEILDGYNLTREDKAAIFLEHRKAFAKDRGFDYRKMLMADQEKGNGSYFEITEEYMNDMLSKRPNGWPDIPEDILVVTEKTPGVVIGHPVADCPVVMISDLRQGVTAIGHCSTDLIDKKLPMMIADVLTEGYGSKEEDLLTIVGPHAGKNSYIYDSYPKWAKDDRIWKDCIVDDNGMFKIDVTKALKKQFRERNLDSGVAILINGSDTITDPRYYSNSARRFDESKFGRQFEGIFYEDNKNVRKR